MSEAVLQPGSPAGSSLLSSFGAASAVLIGGVLAAWIAVKTDVEPVALPAAEDALVMETPRVAAAAEGQSLLEQAEMAFVAGRIVEPEFDNALSYYRALLDADPGDTAALEGIDRVMGYLESEAEGAIFRSDWDAARAYADMIFDVRRGDESALALRQRVDRLERIDLLTARALEQFAAGRLVTPRDDNAADSYRAILELDPAHEVGLQGLRSVVQRLVASAQSAVFAGDGNRAERLIAQVKAVDPKAPGLAEIEQSMRRMKRAEEGTSVQADLARASAALEADRLLPPAQPNAYELFNAVLARQPGSEAAQRGLELVREALAERLRSQIAGGSIDGIEAALIAARSADVPEDVLATLEADARHAIRLARAKAGEFDALYPIGELKVVRQIAPSYPKHAEQRGLEGWVEVEFTVTTMGEVRDATVRDASHSIFEATALNAVGRWRFEPVVEDGHAVPVRSRARFTFRDE